MTDSEFQERVESTLDQVEEYIENLVDTLDLDADTRRSGNVLTIDFEDKGKLILNSQVANHELWLAAKSGGFHYGLKEDGWFNTRTGEKFDSHFVQVLSQQIGVNCPQRTF
jgi:CyaY protein